jgi:hypothetical protein
MRQKYEKEAHVKDDVKALLTKYDWFYWMPPANAYGKTGISDFNAVKRGVFIAIETKFGPNKPTPMQVGFLNSIRAEDGFAFVVNEKNIKWLESFLEVFDRTTTQRLKGEQVLDVDSVEMLNATYYLSNIFLDRAAPLASVEMPAEGGQPLGPTA